MTKEASAAKNATTKEASAAKNAMTKEASAAKNATTKEASAAKNATTKAASAAKNATTKEASAIKVVVPEKETIAKVEQLIGPSAVKSPEWTKLRKRLSAIISQCNNLVAKFQNIQDQDAFEKEFMALASGIDHFVAGCEEDLKLHDDTSEKLSHFVYVIMFEGVQTLTKKYPHVFEKINDA